MEQLFYTDMSYLATISNSCYPAVSWVQVRFGFKETGCGTVGALGEGGEGGEDDGSKEARGGDCPRQGPYPQRDYWKRRT